MQWPFRLKCIQFERFKDKHITILSDSRVTVRSLSSPLTTLKIVDECRNGLNSVSRFNMTELLWVMKGNEILDISLDVRIESNGPSTI